MRINTTRFGELEVDKTDIISFKDGLLGFENLKRFFVVDPGDQTLILWFQSVDDGATAFPIIEPKIYRPEYVVKLLPAELKSLELESLNDASIYTILTIPKTVTDMSANLKAPIVINNKTKLARQIVLQDSKLEVRFKMYAELKKHIVSYSTASDDSRRTKVELAHPEEVTIAEVTVDLETGDEVKKERTPKL
ncbi:MAG: flagellar assembly protein FliW [Halobacteriovoraceae bacterium]|nr:flagellar assembly protein FliW [Halobacteriovoraceae bacterium]MBT5095922.1 flagellar assembly protein FliW [Halobacteriovoraceae bacterium]